MSRGVAGVSALCVRYCVLSGVDSGAQLGYPSWRQAIPRGILELQILAGNCQVPWPEGYAGPSDIALMCKQPAVRALSAVRCVTVTKPRLGTRCAAY